MTTAYSLTQFRTILQGLGYLPATPISHAYHPSESTLDAALSQAIQTFQIDYHLSPTGQLDRATQERARQLIRNLQHSLNLVVQAQLPLNGFYSMATIHAVERFQKQQNRVPTGIADHDLRRVLEQQVKQRLRSQMAVDQALTDALGTSAAV